MTPADTTTAPRKDKTVTPSAGRGSGGGGRPAAPRRREGGFFGQYKPEQGKATRTGTFIGAGLLVAWGAKFVSDQLSGYEDVEAWWGMPVTGCFLF